MPTPNPIEEKCGACNGNCPTCKAGMNCWDCEQILFPETIRQEMMKAHDEINHPLPPSPSKGDNLK